MIVFGFKRLKIVIVKSIFTFLTLLFSKIAPVYATINVLPASDILPRINPYCAVGSFIRLILIIGFVVAMIYFLFGAVKYITASGDKAAIESARGHIANAIIGLVLLLSVFAILFFIETFFGVKILTSGSFTIPQLPHIGGGGAPPPPEVYDC